MDKIHFWCRFLDPDQPRLELKVWTASKNSVREEMMHMEMKTMPAY